MKDLVTNTKPVFSPCYCQTNWMPEWAVPVCVRLWGRCHSLCLQLDTTTLPHRAPNTGNCKQHNSIIINSFIFFIFKLRSSTHCMLYHEQTVYLLTILWTSVFPSDFEWSGLCGGEELTQSEPDSLLSGEGSSPKSGSSSRSLEKEHAFIKKCLYVWEHDVISVLLTWKQNICSKGFIHLSTTLRKVWPTGCIGVNYFNTPFWHKKWEVHFVKKRDV